ncbi:MAG: phosphate/phosphite/phosphonate ABC transporter substrate-binding protein, partial [Bacteroidetes bacterium]|nr:phosphate/phosphite/phosphonate ABC transporter substrate-binding protein [Bacteroidota bacterium]
SNDNYITLVLLHIIIGVSLFLFEPLSKLYFVFLAGFFIIRIVLASNSQKTIEVLLACAYFAGAEVLFRMTKGALAYEASKYLVIVFMVMGMFFKGLNGKGYPYFLYLILLVPAILVASTTLSFDARFRTNIAFVLSGPVCLGVAALFCYDRKVTNKQLLEIITYLALPIITTTTYLFLYNPSIKDTLSGTASNIATSGGFGPNQVSTILGLGIFAIVVRLFLKSPSMFVKLLNLTILGAMTFRAIVTFSRGGVFAAIIVVAAFLWTIFYRSSGKQRNKIFGLFIFVLFVVICLFSRQGQAQDIKPKQLKIVFIAYENPDQLVEDVKPIVAYLKETLNMDIKHFIATDYAGVVEALRNETADMGFMGSLQYVLAHDMAGAYPILGEIYKGKSTYMSKIFVHKDSGITDVKDLKGKTIAFVDPVSSSGYMYPLDIFKQKGLIKNKDNAEKFFRRIYFAGGDEQALRAVLNKFVDAAGIGQYSYNLLNFDERDTILSIAESSPIPSHCVVVRKNLHQPTVEKLQEALFNLNNEPNRHLLKYLYSVDGYIKVNHDNYLSVEELAREYGFLKKK